MNELKNFSIKLGVLTLFIVGVASIFFLVFPQYYLPIMPVLLIYIALLTFGVFYTVLKGLEKNTTRSFNTYFTGANGVKLLLFILFLTVYLFVNAEKALTFSISFLVLYIVYTIFEVRQLVRIVKKMSKSI